MPAGVFPRGGKWIEISSKKITCSAECVFPRGGKWIEINFLFDISVSFLVFPRGGKWIEILSMSPYSIFQTCLPSCRDVEGQRNSQNQSDQHPYPVAGLPAAGIDDGSAKGAEDHVGNFLGGTADANKGSSSLYKPGGSVQRLQSNRLRCRCFHLPRSF